MIPDRALNPDPRHEPSKVPNELRERMTRAEPLREQRMLLRGFGGVIQRPVNHVTAHRNDEFLNLRRRVVAKNRSRRFLIELQSSEEYFKIITTEPHRLSLFNDLTDMRIREKEDRRLRLSFTSIHTMNRGQGGVTLRREFSRRRDETVNGAVLSESALIFLLERVVLLLPEIGRDFGLVLLIG